MSHQPAKQIVRVTIICKKCHVELVVRGPEGEKVIVHCHHCGTINTIKMCELGWKKDADA